MVSLNNVDMMVNANPEEENKMTNLNNDTMMVNAKNKEENKMIELNEKREMMMMAIEGELMQEVVDMVQVEEYEELLAGIEWEIIELLNAYEEQVLEEEYEMEKAVELDGYVDEITPVEKEEELVMNRTVMSYGPLPGGDTDGDEEVIKIGFYEEGLSKDYDHEDEVNYKTNAEFTFYGEEVKSVRPYRLVDTEVGGGTVKVYGKSFDVDAKDEGKHFAYTLHEENKGGVKMQPRMKMGSSISTIEEEKVMNTTERTFGPSAGADTDGDVKYEGIITDLTQDEVREYKARYQESIKRELEYVDVLIGYESYHGQMEYNLIAPALAVHVEEPEGLSKEQASYLLVEESKKQDVIISYVSRALGLSEEAITEFMNE